MEKYEAERACSVGTSVSAASTSSDSLGAQGILPLGIGGISRISKIQHLILQEVGLRSWCWDAKPYKPL